MSYNGSGTFVINSAGQPVVSGTVISSTAFNALTADLATGLSTAITKDGQTTITANIPMANYKFTGLGTGSAAGDSANLSQVQSTAVKLLASVSGADTITAVGAPNVAAYVAGQMFYFVAAAANTGAVTINIDSLGAKSITRDGTTALAAGDIQSGEVCVIVYDGTQFQLVSGSSQSASIITNNLTVTNDALISGLTVGKGGGAVSGNTAVGLDALKVNTTGGANVAVGNLSLDANTTGANNIGIGANAMGVNTSGSFNVAIGDSALAANTTANDNVAVGQSALDANTTGASNVAVGRDALGANTTASENTAVGYQALYSNTTAIRNNAFGIYALRSNTTGTANQAFGEAVLYDNSTGSYNVAVGGQALRFNTTASNNTAVGYQSLYVNTTGAQNVAIGNFTLDANTTASNNTAVGHAALSSNTTGASNVAVGRDALLANTTAIDNTAVGYQALYSTTTGQQNTAIGLQALYDNTTGIYNVAVGRRAGENATTANGNLFLGYGAGSACTTGAGNVVVGDRRLEGLQIFNITTEDNRGIFGHDAITNAYVKVAWTVTSDARDKTDIKPVPHGLAFVQQLNPVSFRWKTNRQNDTPKGSKRYGFLAQDILALEGSDPVIIDAEQDEHLKYQGESLVPVLVKAIQELSAQVEELKAKLGE